MLTMASRCKKRSSNNNEPQAQPLSSPPPHRRRLTLQAAVVNPLTLTNGNVRSLLDSQRSNQPKRRTVPIEREVASYMVAIAVLNEGWFSEQGQMEEGGDKPAQCLEDLQSPDENATVETRWCHLRDAVHSTALGVLGRARRQHHDRFNENDTAISNLIAEKNLLHRDCLDRPTNVKETAFYQCCRLGQQRLQEMQDAWTACKAEVIQGYADHNEMHN
ncbi:hypothetical protein SprV_0200798800 [Sparganum proliferum]